MAKQVPQQPPPAPRKDNRTRQYAIKTAVSPTRASKSPFDPPASLKRKPLPPKQLHFGPKPDDYSASESDSADTDEEEPVAKKRPLSVRIKPITKEYLDSIRYDPILLYHARAFDLKVMKAFCDENGWPHPEITVKARARPPWKQTYSRYICEKAKEAFGTPQ